MGNEKAKRKNIDVLSFMSYDAVKKRKYFHYTLGALTHAKSQGEEKKIQYFL